jgi:hypothetical protein
MRNQLKLLQDAYHSLIQQFHVVIGHPFVAISDLHHIILSA